MELKLDSRPWARATIEFDSPSTAQWIIQHIEEPGLDFQPLLGSGIETEQVVQTSHMKWARIVFSIAPSTGEAYINFATQEAMDLGMLFMPHLQTKLKLEYGEYIRKNDGETRYAIRLTKLATTIDEVDLEGEARAVGIPFHTCQLVRATNGFVASGSRYGPTCRRGCFDRVRCLCSYGQL